MTSHFYRYIYNASFPDLEPRIAPDLGVYHGSMEGLLYSYSSFNRSNMTVQERELQTYMRRAWGRFVRDPLKGPGWPAVGHAVEDLEVLGDVGYEKTGGGRLVSEEFVDRKCAIYQPIYEGLLKGS